MKVSNSSPQQKAFTLIELLIVVAILMILAGMGVGLFKMVNRNAIESRIKAEIQAVCAALEAYKADNGAYPPLDGNAFNGVNSPMGEIAGYDTATATCPRDTTWGNAQPDNVWINGQFLYRALTGSSGGKRYLDLTTKQYSTNISSSTYAPAAPNNMVGVIIDPTGNPYIYQPRGPKYNQRSFDFYSAGLDGTNHLYDANSKDDLGNWKQ
jgi:prepilin-type N-terminal cleavage/methylation domain-containing protein